MRALIIGASRGIGREFVRQYRADGWAVTGTARDENALAALRELGATPLALDITSAESASRLAWQLDGQAFDVIVHVAGVYGPRTTGLEAPTDAEFAQVMATNVLGPMRVLPALPSRWASQPFSLPLHCTVETCQPNVTSRSAKIGLLNAKFMFRASISRRTPSSWREKWVASMPIRIAAVCSPLAMISPKRARCATTASWCSGFWSLLSRANAAMSSRE